MKDWLTACHTFKKKFTKLIWLVFEIDTKKALTRNLKALYYSCNQGDVEER
ncbi:hypothetical protein LC2W_0471 [Lacticaseibacillus paracasei]|nr:hypothetical protein LC2W_0471 [Lacticaseibacillus paracasei]EPC34994.1 hypothetical protein Lpp223_0862 [Lacticaseibacillus paracasei subsp. paracasei Lpp223]KTE98362.1 hypothetical protein AC564_1943c [Lacticaseibacillus paracasei]OUC71960.1 hypothetical protein BLL69_0298 [Lacticaseibacillus paracasei]